MFFIYKKLFRIENFPKISTSQKLAFSKLKINVFIYLSLSFIAHLLLRNRKISKNGLMLKKRHTTKVIAINICQ